MTLGLLLSSCSSASKQMPETAAPARKDDTFWIGDKVAGSPRLVIDLSAQRIRYYKGEKLVGVSPISSGRESHSTVTGRFKISEKDIDHRSSLYGSYVDAEGNVVREDVDVRKDSRPAGTRFVGAKMNYFMRVVGAIGMHEGYLPGYPASHGCIRLPSHMAAAFYHATPHGTPVQIVGNASLAEYESPVTRPAGVTGNVKKPETRKSSRSHNWPGPGGGRRSKTPRGQTVPPGTTLYL